MAIALLALPSTHPYQPWGYFIGLASQPFHIVASVLARQWGSFILSFWFTAAWIIGIWNHLL
jgi:hypothetical protein